MSKMKFGESKIVNFFTGKGFYVVLAICLLAIGAAAWTALSTLKPPPIDTGDLDTSSEVSVPSENAANVGNNVSDVKDNRPDSSDYKPDDNESEESTIETVANPVANFFVLPVTGNIIKEFSDKELQYSETYLDMRIHYGVDIATEQGTRICSSGDGKVIDISTDPIWGTTVTIDHGNGIFGYYSGLNEKTTVKKEAIVEPGSELGSLGTIPCEASDAPHLHMAFKKDDKWVSPLSLMDMEE